MEKRKSYWAELTEKFGSSEKFHSAEKVNFFSRSQKKVFVLLCFKVRPYICMDTRASLVAQMVKNLAAMQEI